MGWWTTEGQGEELVLGDEPLDAVLRMLRSVARTYNRACGRKPTINEIAEMIRSSLEIVADEVASGVADMEVARVTIKMRRAPKKHSFSYGDYFAVPLSQGDYGYGRVVSVPLKELVVVDFLDLRSRSVLALGDVLGAPDLVRVACGTEALRRGEWRVVGNVPIPGRQPSYDEACRGLRASYPPALAVRLLEWRLEGKPGTPWPDIRCPE